MDFLQLEGKRFLVFGIANRKSVACHIARALEEAGAQIVLVVRTPQRRDSVSKLFPEATIYVCDVEEPSQIEQLREEISADNQPLNGLVHSIAFADYSEGMKPFHETPKQAFLQAVDISCYSLMALCNALKDRFDPDASVVTISISTTHHAFQSNTR